MDGEGRERDGILDDAMLGVWKDGIDSP